MYYCFLNERFPFRFFNYFADLLRFFRRLEQFGKKKKIFNKNGDNKVPIFILYNIFDDSIQNYFEIVGIYVTQTD